MTRNTTGSPSTRLTRIEQREQQRRGWLATRAHGPDPAIVAAEAAYAAACAAGLDRLPCPHWPNAIPPISEATHLAEQAYLAVHGPPQTGAEREWARLWPCAEERDAGHL
jgi:hypothetical protein